MVITLFIPDGPGLFFFEQLWKHETWWLPEPWYAFWRSSRKSRWIYCYLSLFMHNIWEKCHTGSFEFFLWLTKCIGCEYNKDNQTFFAENDILVSCMKQFPYNCSNIVAFKADLFHNWKNDLKCSEYVNWRCSNGVDYRDRIIGRFPRDVIENQSRWTWWGAGSRGFIILFISYKINLLIHFTHVDNSGKVNINQSSDRSEVEFHRKMKVRVFVLNNIDSMIYIKIAFELT